MKLVPGCYMNTELVVGIAASIFTSASMLPQLVKLAREKKAGEISMGMLIILVTGLSCWIAYGIMKEDWILICANGFSWVVTVLMIIFTLKYK